MAGYYGFMFDVRVSIRANIKGLGAFLDKIGHNVQHDFCQVIRFIQTCE